jgi:RND family efflux transporter MFP subunit
MNEIQQFPVVDADARSRTDPGDRGPGRPPAEPNRPATDPNSPTVKTKRVGGARLLAVCVLVLLGGALAIGFWQHYRLNAQVLTTAEQRRDFIPTVRAAPIRASASTMTVTWPGTTEAFEQANLYARASGYISRRDVDIGSRVKAGQLLIEITAPELEHQIAQAEGNLAQMKASLELAKANRDLAKVTWNRDDPLVEKGWVTPQQGDTDRLNLQAREASVAVAEANIKAQDALLLVLHQQKIYQTVVAPFDGVITQRNIDIGSLVTADATSGTFLFTLMHSDVLRIQLYVPQDEAFGIGPGVVAIVHVPEVPGRDFPGTVARTADALQPGSRTLLTEIDVPNPDHALSPGVYCTVELKIPRKTPSMIVPSEAIIFNRDGLSVAVVENGVARIHPVTVVRDFGTTVEVSAGVKEGDQVILNPPVDFIDGQKVQVRPGPPAQLS